MDRGRAGRPANPMPFSPMHEHVFIGAGRRRNERRIRWVIGLTAATMPARLISGNDFG